jgi:hypothetical protein
MSAMQELGQICEIGDHELVDDLGKRLDAVWRYDQYIANADGKPGLQKLWRYLKRQEIDNITHIKQMIAPMRSRADDFERLSSSHYGSFGT